jgi:hypothetical protein
MMSCVVVVVVDIVGEGRAVRCQLMMHSPGSCVCDGRGCDDGGNCLSLATWCLLHASMSGGSHGFDDGDGDGR